MTHLEDDFVEDEFPDVELTDEELDAIFGVNGNDEEWDDEDVELERYDTDTRYRPPLDFLEGEVFMDRLNEIYEELRDQGFMDS
jgi:hypothetical protein